MCATCARNSLRVCVPIVITTHIHSINSPFLPIPTGCFRNSPAGPNGFPHHPAAHHHLQHQHHQHHPLGGVGGVGGTPRGYLEARAPFSAQLRDLETYKRKSTSSATPTATSATPSNAATAAAATTAAHNATANVSGGAVPQISGVGTGSSINNNNNNSNSNNNNNNSTSNNNNNNGGGGGDHNGVGGTADCRGAISSNANIADCHDYKLNAPQILGTYPCTDITLVTHRQQWNK